MSTNLSPQQWTSALLRMLLAVAQRRGENVCVESAEGIGGLLDDLLAGFQASAAVCWSNAGLVAARGPEQTRLAEAAEARQAAERAVGQSARGVSLNVSWMPVQFAAGQALLTIPLDGSIATDAKLIQLLVTGDPSPNAQLAMLQAAKLVGQLHQPVAERAVSGADPRFDSLIRFHHSLDLRETAYEVANDTRAVLDCSRVSVLMCEGRHCRLAAASGQIQPDRRANVVRALERLASRIAAQRESFAYPATDSTHSDVPPQIESALSDYLDQSPTTSLRVIPMFSADVQREADGTPESAADLRLNESAPFAVLVIEDFQRRDVLLDATWLALTIRSAATALFNSRRHQRVFLLPLWRSLGNWCYEPRWRWVRRLGAAATVALLMALAFLPANFQIVVGGKLQPKQRRHIFAAANGIVQRVYVQHGDRVQAGQRLIELDNPEITRMLDELLGQIQIARQQLASLNALRLGAARGGGDVDRRQLQANDNRLAAEQQRLKMQIANLQRQCDLLESQQQQLAIVSPAAGTVVTWDVEQTIAARPLQRGQQLLTIADEEGVWELVLYARDRQAGQIRTAQQQAADALPVTFSLGTSPRGRYRGRLASVAKAAQQHAQLGSAVKVTVDVDGADLPARHDGAEVRAKIECGRRRLAYVWFHQLVDLFYTRVLFYLR